LPTSSALAAQEVEDGARAPRGSQFLLPFGSLLVPGLGQYVQGAPGPGLAYTGTAILGLVAAEQGDPGFTSGDDLPRSGRDQLAFEGAQLAFTAGALSAWDSFHRAVPAMQREGGYAFLPPRESLGQVLAAPFDVTFLERWTTWVSMAYALGVAGAVLSQRDDGVEYEPFTGGDAAFVGGLSFNAAIAEEAMFRGWLLPMLHQTTGRRFWTANAVQAALFARGTSTGREGSPWPSWRGRPTRGG
jgi:hypothetical protein